jgi:hypothetical protein
MRTIESFRETDKYLTRISNTYPIENWGDLSNDISTNNTEYKLLQLLANTIAEQYDEAIELVTTFIEQHDELDINTIPLCFTYSDEFYLARAHYKDRKISVNLKSLLDTQLDLTIIHEIAHFICNYLVEKNGGHCLEFAIINYCIAFKHNKQREHFLRSYDIYEDKSFHFLAINSCEFDAFIKNISWNSIEELAEKSKILAEETRKKYVPHNLL